MKQLEGNPGHQNVWAVDDFPLHRYRQQPIPKRTHNVGQLG